MCEACTAVILVMSESIIKITCLEIIKITWHTQSHEWLAQFD